MKNLKKLLAALLVLLLVVGCSSKTDDKDGDVVELLMYQVGSEPDHFDEIMEKVNGIAEEEIGVRVNLEYIDWGDWDDKMGMIISSGEYYDIALAHDYVINAQRGAFTDIKDLVDEHAADFFASLDPVYIDGNTFDGKLYAFPVNGNVFAQQMLTFNQELLDKHNLSLDGVETLEDTEALLQVIKDNEDEVVPYAIGRGHRHVLGNFDYILGDSLPFAVHLDGDHEKIINPYTTDSAMEFLTTVHDFYNKGFIPKGAATEDTSFRLEENTWFMRGETQGPMDYGDYMLTTAARKPLVSFPITKGLKSTGQARMANFVVANNSKYPEEAVKFLTLMNTNEEVLNTLIHGIEGEQWTRIDDMHIDKKIAHNLMSPWNTGNNHIIYVTEDVTDEMIAERDEAIANAVASPIVGFNFDSDPVKNELAAVQTVMDKYNDTVNTGTANPADILPEMFAELETAGVQVILDEMQAQYDAWRS